MKGLSPIVATIILIAFAVAIGGMVALWLTGFATQTTQFTSDQGNKLTSCGGARLAFETVTNSSIIYSNPTVYQLTNVTIYSGDGLSLMQNSTTLNAGQVANLTWSRGSNSSVFMKGVCQNTIVVEGKCGSGEVCWQ